jgi:putative ABC transport system permease protein
MQNFIQDVSYGIRGLMKSPLIALAAVTTIALGIGATTAIFSVVNALVLRPLPYPKSEQLMIVGAPMGDDEVSYSGVPQYMFTRDQTQAFSALAVYQPIFSGVNLAGGDEPEFVEGLRVSKEFFRAVGVGPVLGREFTSQEDSVDGERVAVISNDLWRRRFGGDPGLVGRPVSINGQSHLIVGVMPQGFEFWDDGDVYLPIRPSLQSDASQNHLIFGRLKEGLTLGQARVDLKRVAELYRAANPAKMKERETISAAPVQRYLAREIRGSLWILLGAVGFVLLIACVNVANMQITRAVERRKEIAVRLALGARPGRILKMLVTEGVLLSVFGAVAGVTLAWWGLDILKTFLPEGMLPMVGEITLDWRVGAFALAASLLTGVVFGLAPATQAMKFDLNHALKEGAGQNGGGASEGRLRGALVVIEVALSLVLLAGAGLLIRTFVNMNRVQPGFDPSHLLTFQATPMGPKYQAGEAIREYYRQTLERLHALPGVESATATNVLPLSAQFRMGFEIAGRPNIPENVQFRTVSSEYFQTMKTSIVRGRGFTGDDGPGAAPVLIVNEAFLRRYLPNDDPFEMQVSVGRRMAGETPRRIVGIAGDSKQFGLKDEATPTFYIPIEQAPDQVIRILQRFTPVKFALRTSGDPMALAGAVRQAMANVDPALPVTRVRSMEQIVSLSAAQDRFYLLLLALFAGAGLTLSAIGVYGVMSYTVSRRTKEIGLRFALGAQVKDVLRLVITQGMKLTFIGILLGLLAAFGLTRLMKGFLFGVTAVDPATFAGIAVVSTLVALAACWIPARRASRVDPLTAIRYE